MLYCDAKHLNILRGSSHVRCYLLDQQQKALEQETLKKTVKLSFLSLRIEIRFF